ncbi:hypothetical protein DB31_1883 [Hyalangium minutum]|uniref:Uncharacterized protein n=1 Tax=Hyalangium minutum TaxID=394096 RepID=A0A085WB02_9BACT|nr:hypothetical protein DB31_1883 [Hyalangium minutum]
MALGVCISACSPDTSDTDTDPGGSDTEGDAGADGSTDGGGSDGGTSDGSRPFSFFVTSLEAMRQLSGSQNGFGGDLRFGEATGLEGADKICRTIAEMSEPGAGQREWRAFLSTSTGSALRPSEGSASGV